MTEGPNSGAEGSSIGSAIEAFRRGFTPVPLHSRQKRPYGMEWQTTRYPDSESVEAAFKEYGQRGAGNVGLLLGKASNGLVDIDLDHPTMKRLHEVAFHDLPTAMVSGRRGRPQSHYWYRVTDELPDYRKYTLPDQTTLVELRSTAGHQTAIPPSIHPSGERYTWHGEAFGGDAGPTEITARVLASRVAMLGIAGVLVDNWPAKGSRHDAYLALAGGLMRLGYEVNEWWSERDMVNLRSLIKLVAIGTRDQDGVDTRIMETCRTTMRRLQDGKPAIGYPSLAGFIGDKHVDKVRQYARIIEDIAWTDAASKREAAEIRVRERVNVEGSEVEEDPDALFSLETVKVKEPINRPWRSGDIEPYLAGDIELPQASMFMRTDGNGLWYQGRVNLLYGPSESGKSWLAMFACVQEMAEGGRVLYLDFEDDRMGTINRFRMLGAADDDVRNYLRVINPDEPLGGLLRDRWLKAPPEGTYPEAEQNEADFREELKWGPTLIVTDGITELYNLHGLNTNDTGSAAVVTSWLRRLTDRGKRTVGMIDHTGKDGTGGPIGSQHKNAAVTGTSIRVQIEQQPIGGHVGTLRLEVTKDRPTEVRRVSTLTRPQICGIATIDGTEDKRVRIKVEPANPDEVVIGSSEKQERELQAMIAAEELLDRILLLFGGDFDKGLKTPEVVGLLFGSKALAHDSPETKRVRVAWQAGLSRGLVRVTNPRTRYATYWLVDQESDGSEPSAEDGES